MLALRNAQIKGNAFRDMYVITVAIGMTESIT